MARRKKQKNYEDDDTLLTFRKILQMEDKIVFNTSFLRRWYFSFLTFYEKHENLKRIENRKCFIRDSA